MPVFERVAADFPVTLKTASYALVVDDTGTEIQFQSASTLTANLPSVSAVDNGYNVIIRNVGPGTLTIGPAGEDQIDGAGSVSLGVDEWRWIRNDGTTWKSISTNEINGDVIGPGSSSDNAIARFDGTDGKHIQNSAAFIDDSGNISATNLSGTNTGDQSLTGDVSGSAANPISTTIANNAVTYAKMQDVSAASKLLGRGDLGSGDPQEIAVGTGLVMTGTTLSATAGATTLTGDVTGSGTGSIATTIAPDAVTTAKIAADAVTFAKMQNIATDRLIGRDTAGSGDLEEISVGGGVEFTGSGGIQISNAGVTIVKLANAAKPYDFSFIAGFDATMSAINLVAQSYATLVIARDLTIEGGVGAIANAPSVSDVVLDVLRNGTTIYPTTKPQFSTSGTFSAGSLGTTTFTSGDILTFSVTPPVTGTPGKGVRFTLKTHLA